MGSRTAPYVGALGGLRQEAGTGAPGSSGLGGHAGPTPQGGGQGRRGRRSQGENSDAAASNAAELLLCYYMLAACYVFRYEFNVF